MKKYILILILILIGSYIGLSLFDLKGGEYKAEKLFYNAAKITDRIAKNPDVIPPGLFSSAENNLKTILEKYSQSKSAIPARIMLVELYSLNKEHDKAVAVLDTILNTPDLSRDVLSKSHLVKGNIYEKQENWDKAIAEYRLLGDEFQDTMHGVQMPLFISDFYSRTGKEEQANEAYNNAVVFYEKMTKENEGQVLGYMASALLLESYFRLENYEEAGRVAQDTINNYPSSLTYMQYLPKINFIYVETLNNPTKAIDIYKNVMNKTTDAKLKERIAEIIESLTKKIEVKS